jgi:hypothetical protein
VAPPWTLDKCERTGIVRRARAAVLGLPGDLKARWGGSLGGTWWTGLPEAEQSNLPLAYYAMKNACLWDRVSSIGGAPYYDLSPNLVREYGALKALLDTLGVKEEAWRVRLEAGGFLPEFVAMSPADLDKMLPQDPKAMESLLTN